MERDSCSLTHDYEGRVEPRAAGSLRPPGSWPRKKEKNRKEKQKEVTLFSTTDNLLFL